jgi:hypothetical protein
MDKPSELLIRSALHDLTNVLAGIRGILDLNSPGEPLTSRDRDRLEAVIDEALTTLDRTRNLAMEQLPEAALEAFETWRGQLQEQLQPMAVIFRRPIEVTGADPDPWPGEPLRGFVRAVTRQVLPYIRTGHLAIRCQARPDHWSVAWEGVLAIPEALSGEGGPRDIASRWATQLAATLAIRLSLEDGALVARMPRT